MPTWDLYKPRISRVVSSSFLHQKLPLLRQNSSNNISDHSSLSVLYPEFLTGHSWGSASVPAFVILPLRSSFNARILLYFDQLSLDLRGVKRTPSFVWPIRLTLLSIQP